ncbi:MAG: hypothetical protein SVZ03_06820 [Spirochaetota bacterium]|nr:hypothetical protein [Spirochaetota bacterium]
MDKRLEHAVNNFINNPDKVRLDKEDNRLYLSSIFKWYNKDFPLSKEAKQLFKGYNDKDRRVIVFLANYFPEDVMRYIIMNKPEIKYLKYDWSLNEKR